MCLTRCQVQRKAEEEVDRDLDIVQAVVEELDVLLQRRREAQRQPVSVQRRRLGRRLHLRLDALRFVRPREVTKLAHSTGTQATWPAMAKWLGDRWQLHTEAPDRHSRHPRVNCVSTAHCRR